MEKLGLNPFHTGRGLSTEMAVFAADAEVLIPFIQGGVFRLRAQALADYAESLNPFHTGRGLSTEKKSEFWLNVGVS